MQRRSDGQSVEIRGGGGKNRIEKHYLCSQLPRATYSTLMLRSTIFAPLRASIALVASSTLENWTNAKFLLISVFKGIEKLEAAMCKIKIKIAKTWGKYPNNSTIATE